MPGADAGRVRPGGRCRRQRRSTSRNS